MGAKWSRTRVVIRNGSGDRVVSMHDFHRGPYETAVADAIRWGAFHRDLPPLELTEPRKETV